MMLGLLSYKIFAENNVTNPEYNMQKIGAKKKVEECLLKQMNLQKKNKEGEVRNIPPAIAQDKDPTAMDFSNSSEEESMRTNIKGFPGPTKTTGLDNDIIVSDHVMDNDNSTSQFHYPMSRRL